MTNPGTCRIFFFFKFFLVINLLYTLGRGSTTFPFVGTEQFVCFIKELYFYIFGIVCPAVGKHYWAFFGTVCLLHFVIILRQSVCCTFKVPFLGQCVCCSRDSLLDHFWDSVSFSREALLGHFWNSVCVLHFVIFLRQIVCCTR